MYADAQDPAVSGGMLKLVLLLTGADHTTRVQNIRDGSLRDYFDTIFRPAPTAWCNDCFVAQHSKYPVVVGAAGRSMCSASLYT